MAIKCVIGGDVDFFQWFVSDLLIESGKNDYTVLPNTSLVIDNFGKHHKGVYKCSAENAVEKRTVKTVLYFPEQS